MTSLRCSARVVTHTLELLGTKQRPVCVISSSHTQLLHTRNLPLVPKDHCITPASCVAQQQTLRGFAAGTVHPPRTGPVLPDSVPRPVPGTEDFQAATNSSSDSDAEDDGPDLSALVQGPAVPETQKDELLQKIQSSSKKHQRHILSQLLSGNELTGAPTMGEDESNAAINAARQKYSLKLVDVNSTNKGSPAGGVQSFSAMVVVGNREGLLGHGTGKAAELAFEQLSTIEQKAKEMGMAAVEVIVGSRPKPKQRFKYASRLSK
ncbi:hypothetical protein WJX79_000103 [Trebouxia sp. C0005]